MTAAYGAESLVYSRPACSRLTTNRDLQRLAEGDPVESCYDVIRDRKARKVSSFVRLVLYTEQSADQIDCDGGYIVRNLCCPFYHRIQEAMMSQVTPFAGVHEYPMAANRKRSSSATKLTAALGALASVGSTRPIAASSPSQQDSKYFMVPESISSTSLDGIHTPVLSAASSANSSQTNLTSNADGQSATRVSPSSGDVITINFANQGSMSDPEVI